MAPPPNTKTRPRSLALRWGPGVPLSLHEYLALGIRYDEEEDRTAESFVVRLSPGRLELLDQLLGQRLDDGPAIAVTAAGVPLALDGRGVVHVQGRKHKLAAPRSLVAHGDGVLLAGDDRLWIFPPDGGSPERGPNVKARRLASCSGTLAIVDDGGAVHVGALGALQPVTVEGSARPSAITLDEGGQILAAAGKTILRGDASGLRAVATAPFEVHAVCLFRGRALFSSRAYGLFHMDEDGKPAPLKPSVRAHTMTVRGGVLLASSDLSLAATDDLMDWLTRDLAAFMRAAEQRLPRFLQPEDAAGV